MIGRYVDEEIKVLYSSKQICLLRSLILFIKSHTPMHEIPIFSTLSKMVFSEKIILENEKKKKRLFCTQTTNINNSVDILYAINLFI